METSPRPVLPGDVGPARPGAPEVRRSGRRRRPTGAPPPLPRRIQITSVWWAVAAVILVRADRSYKLGRALLYGRLEDEKPFNTVKRLVQQEDYAPVLMQRAGLPSPDPFGVAELTPERST